MLTANKLTSLTEHIEQEVKTGVPEGFYKNEYLVRINKGSLSPDQEGKIPKTMPCWKEDCDKPLEVCGYPFYICENKHAYNVKTGEKWLWKSTDEVYHGLLNVLQDHIEPAYQKLFFSGSRATVHTEADRVSTSLGGIGKILYDILKIEEEDPYNWGRDELKHYAGLRFAINMMHTAIQEGRRIKFPSDELPATTPYKEKYDFDAHAYWTEHGEETIKQMLLSIGTVKTEYKRHRPTQTSLLNYS